MEKEKEQTKTKFDQHRYDQTKYTVGEVVILSRALLARVNRQNFKISIKGH